MVVGVTGTPEVGTTTASIQAYLRGLYNNATPEQPAPSFVLFVGDIDADADLDRERRRHRPSLLRHRRRPDAGHLLRPLLRPRNPTKLQAILDKTLMYDQFTMPDPSYLGEVVMIAGMDGSFGSVWANGQINYGTTYYFNAAHGIHSHTTSTRPRAARTRRSCRT